MPRRSVLFSVLVIVLAAGVCVATTGDDRIVVRVAVADRAEVNLVASVAEPWEVDLDEGFLILDVDDDGLARLLELGLEVEVDEKRTRRLNAPQMPLKGQRSGIPGFPCYRTVEETLATGAALAAAHPDLASWIDIGDLSLIHI